jgi:hypothetical protein
VPFSQRFYDLTQLQQYVFFASLLCTTAATLLLIASSAHQRLLWHQGEREPNLRVENKLTIAGLIYLGPAMSGAIFLITDLIFDLLIASAVITVMIGSFVWLWFALPLLYRSRNRRHQNRNRSRGYQANKDRLQEITMYALLKAQSLLTSL